MEELFALLLQSVLSGVEKGVEDGVSYTIKKVADTAGDCIVKLVTQEDTDGDGQYDVETVICELDSIIPVMYNGYCLSERDEKLGVGIPYYELLDGYEIGDYVEFDKVSGSKNGYLINKGDDRENDDILVPLGYDFNGDSVPDWGWIVDENRNGVPDASPNGPFYPVGSEQYQYFIDQAAGNYEPPALQKPFADYSVSEALLLCCAGGVLVYLFSKLFKRRHYL